MRAVVDGCGCFPTGRHYAGIAHLLRAVARGLVEEFGADAPWMDLPVALLDVETTGRDASTDRVVELGIVIWRNGDVAERHNWLINPGIPIPAEASSVHQITDEMVKDKPRFEDVAHEIAAALAGCIPAAYNAAFDRAFLHNEMARAAFRGAPPPALRKDIEWLDPLVWARELQHDERSKSLGEVAARLGVKLESAHRAQDDAEAALRVLYILAKDARVPKLYGPVVQEQRRLSLLHADERRRWTRPS
jgi:DNA polymerase-3 subunit epsilon